MTRGSRYTGPIELLQDVNVETLSALLTLDLMMMVTKIYIGPVDKKESVKQYEIQGS